MEGKGESLYMRREKGQTKLCQVCYRWDTVISLSLSVQVQEKCL